MNKKFELIRRVVMWGLIAIGIGVLILVLVVNSKGLTGWQDPITLTLWIYLLSVFIYIIFLNAIPMAWNHFRKR